MPLLWVLDNNNGVGLRVEGRRRALKHDASKQASKQPQQQQQPQPQPHLAVDNVAFGVDLLPLLCSACVDTLQRVIIPPLPEKKLTGTFETEFLQNRTRFLHKFLERCLDHPELKAAQVSAVHAIGGGFEYTVIGDLASSSSYQRRVA